MFLRTWYAKAPKQRSETTEQAIWTTHRTWDSIRRILPSLINRWIRGRVAWHGCITTWIARTLKRQLPTSEWPPRSSQGRAATLRSEDCRTSQAAPLLTTCPEVLTIICNLMAIRSNDTAIPERAIRTITKCCFSHNSKRRAYTVARAAMLTPTTLTITLISKTTATAIIASRCRTRPLSRRELQIEKRRRASSKTITTTFNSSNKWTRRQTHRTSSTSRLVTRSITENQANPKWGTRRT